MKELPIDPAVELYRKCGRCGADVYATDPPHLCKDIAKRLAKREKQKEAVKYIFSQYGVNPEVQDELAEEVIIKLVGMGVEND